MGIKQVKLDVNEITVGMFVSGLDRPWSQTPFPLQGFYIRDLDEIKQLKNICRHVYIDVMRGRAPMAANLKSLPADTLKHRINRRENTAAPSNIKVARLRIQRDAYPEVKPLKREIRKAKQLHQNVYHAVGEVLGYLGSNELHRVPMTDTKRLASDMVRGRA